MVAPATGVFRAADGHPDETAPGLVVGDQTDLGHVDARGGGVAVSPNFSGTLIEWLVEDGDPVNEGQPLVRLLPQSAE